MIQTKEGVFHNTHLIEYNNNYNNINIKTKSFVVHGVFDTQHRALDKRALKCTSPLHLSSWTWDQSYSPCTSEA